MSAPMTRKTANEAEPPSPDFSSILAAELATGR